MVILVMYVRKTVNHMRRALPVFVEVTVGIAEQQILCP